VLIFSLALVATLFGIYRKSFIWLAKQQADKMTFMKFWQLPGFQAFLRPFQCWWEVEEPSHWLQRTCSFWNFRLNRLEYSKFFRTLEKGKFFYGGLNVGRAAKLMLKVYLHDRYFRQKSLIVCDYLFCHNNMMLRTDFYIGENFTQINGLEFNCNAAFESEVKIQQNEKLSKEIKRLNASSAVVQPLFPKVIFT